MFDDLATNNWASSHSVFSKSFCQTLARKCQKLSLEGKLTPAAIGKGAQKTTREEIRGDSTWWLDENNCSLPEQEALDVIQKILEALNLSFYLGLKRFEAHFALYPPKSGYDKHVDNPRGNSARKITFILYLNANWQQDHGGILSIYDPQNENLKIAQIQPTLGTFVLFRSDLFPHQVEQSFHPRMSLTGWFRDDAL